MQSRTKTWGKNDPDMLLEKMSEARRYIKTTLLHLVPSIPALLLIFLFTPLALCFESGATTVG